MSRRHHGGRPHRPGGHHRQPSGPIAPSVDQSRPEKPPLVTSSAPTPATARERDAADVEMVAVASPIAPGVAEGPQASPTRTAQQNGGAGPIGQTSGGCTAPQLRRFIKSRPYVPMHELRRRFGINGADDDVTPVDLAGGRIYVGLPPREGGLVGELLRAGDIGFELSLDPRTPIVVGLYPMRPVPRA